jgi:uncharacterized membrane protein
MTSPVKEQVVGWPTVLTYSVLGIIIVMRTPLNCWFSAVQLW